MINHKRTTMAAALSAAMLCGGLLAERAHAQQIEEVDVYVWIDYDQEDPLLREARMYREFPGNVLLPLGQNVGGTSEFQIYELFDLGPFDHNVHFLGVSNVRIMHGFEPDPWQVVPTEDFSDVPESRRHVYDMTLTATGRLARDPCNRVWPIAAGHELTTYDFRDIPVIQKEYGMKFNGVDTMAGATWTWLNPANTSYLGHHGVYLTFTLVFDLDPESQYTDVNVSWISAVYCDHDFCLPSNQVTERIGPEWQVPAGVSGRIVMAVPVLHDHSEWMHLVLNDNPLFTATPDYPPQDKPAGHRCASGDQSPVAWHTHAGHFDKAALQGSVAMPGETGPTFGPGDLVWVHALYDVPLHLLQAPVPSDQPINGRALWIVFWEPGN